MATADDVAAFTTITGEPESVAIRKLEEHEGNLNDAVNGHFLEREKHNLYALVVTSNQNPLAQSSASHVPDAEIEEAMVQAAIMASKMDESGRSSWEQIDVLNDSSDGDLAQNLSPDKQEEFARAISLSLEEDDDLESTQSDKEGLTYMTNIKTHLACQDSSYRKLSQKFSLQDEDLARAFVMHLKDNAYYLESQRSDSGYGLETPPSNTASEEEASRKFILVLHLQSLRPVHFAPAGSDEMAQVITIAVRMPDGRRLARCFRKTQTFQDLFNFVDNVGFRATESRNYRFVRQYPRHTFSVKDRWSTFYDEGIRKDETLYLEWI
ncbi:hypothetical protein VNO78_25329 [Psophocarpus tetragonolobus]|uniref:UBX domain-containing protein n=1 Tax=Psophocarpus tetragonolobus TaxID=3891 RepID=A0AAN9XFC5_PSOTE